MELQSANSTPVAPVPYSSFDQGVAPSNDLNRQIARFRRRLTLFLSVAGAVFAVLMVITLILPPSYTAYTQVMLDPRQNKVVDTEQVLGTSFMGGPQDTSVVDTQVEVLKSRNLAEKTVADLKLDQDEEFNKRLAPKSIIAKIIPMPEDNDPVHIHNDVVDRVMKNTKVSRNNLTYVLNVAFTSKDPSKAATIANALTDNYLAAQQSEKFEANQRASDFLSRRIETLKGQVQQAEAAVELYKSQHGLQSLTDNMGATPTGQVSIGQTITQQEIANLDAQLASARAQEAESTARLRTAKAQLAAGSNGLDVGEALMSPLVSELRNKRTEVTGVIADLQGKYGPKHPDLLKAQRQLADLDKQIQSEVGRVTSNLNAQVEVARQRTQSIESSLGKLRGSLTVGGAASVQLNELERNAQSVRSLYQYYLDRYKQTSTQQGLESPDAKIVSRSSERNEQSFPNIPLFVALSVIIALGAAVTTFLFVDATHSGLFTSEDIENELGVSHLGSIPLAGSIAGEAGVPKGVEPLHYVVDHPLSGFAESFRNLKASLLFSRGGDPVHVIAVTSALPGEGKTTTAICLGQVSAMGGTRTIVVDCDLRRRTVNQLFSNKPALGLLDVLSGNATLDETIVRDQASGAYFLPISDRIFAPHDLFASAAMAKLISELRQRFDLVILDTAPVLAVTDTRMLAAKVDAVVMVTQWNKTPRKAVESALRQLESTRGFVAGIALTQVNIQKQAKWGYGDAYYYYASYASYYNEGGKAAAPSLELQAEG